MEHLLPLREELTHKLMPHIVPFGPSFPGQKGIGHQPNEWMKIEDLIKNAKIYALGIYYLGML